MEVLGLPAVGIATLNRAIKLGGPQQCVMSNETRKGTGFGSGIDTGGRTEPGCPCRPTVRDADGDDEFMIVAAHDADAPADLELALYQALVELRLGLLAPRQPNRLRQLRGNRFTQEELAERVGVSTSAYKYS